SGVSSTVETAGEHGYGSSRLPAPFPIMASAATPRDATRTRLSATPSNLRIPRGPAAIEAPVARTLLLRLTVLTPPSPRDTPCAPRPRTHRLWNRGYWCRLWPSRVREDDREGGPNCRSPRSRRGGGLPVPRAWYRSDEGWPPSRRSGPVLVVAA